MLVLWVVLVFVLGTTFFYFFPRTLAAVSILALCFSAADLLATLNIFSMHSQLENGVDLDTAALLIAAMILFWLIPGIVADCCLIKTRVSTCVQQVQRFGYRTAKDDPLK